MERDEETGFAYHGARYYSSWLGRWVSADPIGVKGGINLFGYSSQNPIGYSDKNGFEPDIGSFNKEIDTNHDNRITDKELETGLACSTITAEDWYRQMSVDRGGFTFDRAVEEKIPSLFGPSQSSSSREASYKHQETCYANGPGDPPTCSTAAERDRVADELSHPSRKIGSDLKTFTVAAATLAFPEEAAVVQTVRGIAHKDPEEVAQGVFGYVFARVGRGLSGSSSNASRSNLISSRVSTADYSGSLEWRPYTPSVVTERDIFAGTEHGEIMINPNTGDLRELQVAEKVNGTVSKVGREDLKLKTPKGQTVTVDVIGPNGELIVVGGPSKGVGNLGHLGDNLSRLKQAADARGVAALAYFTEDTAAEAIKLAWKWLGIDNVHYF
jgi:RHS repeat-associated protein